MPEVSLLEWQKRFGAERAYGKVLVKFDGTMVLYVRDATRKMRVSLYHSEKISILSMPVSSFDNGWHIVSFADTDRCSSSRHHLFSKQRTYLQGNAGSINSADRIRG